MGPLPQESIEGSTKEAKFEKKSYTLGSEVFSICGKYLGCENPLCIPSCIKELSTLHYKIFELKIGVFQFDNHCDFQVANGTDNLLTSSYHNIIISKIMEHCREIDTLLKSNLNDRKPIIIIRRKKRGEDNR